MLRRASVTRPPALRMTWASPSSRPRARAVSGKIHSQPRLRNPAVLFGPTQSCVHAGYDGDLAVELALVRRSLEEKEVAHERTAEEGAANRLL